MSYDDHRDAPFADPDRPVDERVADLLSRMTLEEKLGQIGSAWIFQLADSDGLDLGRAADHLKAGLGHVTRISGASSLTAREAAEMANEIQQHLREETRLGLPAIVHEEICSGFMTREAAIFPQAIGVAATFRPEHNRAAADAIRRQMRAMGAHQGLSPVLDICRDARWGRLEETYGEDPHLVAAMGNAFVEGLQGDDLVDGVVATAKHFVGYGASEGGMNWAPPHIGPRELRDTYLKPFEHAVRHAGLASIMNAYSELDGVPCGANAWLLEDLLRTRWGFTGTVVADYFSVDQLRGYHRVVADQAEAAETALAAGIDVELPNTDCYGKPLQEGVERGSIDPALVDRAVTRVLNTKIALGLLDDPYVDVEAVDAVTRTEDQLDLASDMARDSLVLLRNDGILPLASPATVAVIGPNADDARAMLGDYSYVAHVESLLDLLESGENVLSLPVEDGVDVGGTIDMSHVTTVLGGLQAQLPDATITHVRGCDVRSEDRSQIPAAVEAAAQADVAVMVIGERSGLTVDCTTGESRDVTSLSLAGVQEELVLAVAETGTPVVLVIVGGRPVGSPAVHEAAAAVLHAWLPGERGGTVIAQALTGAFSPGGKLPVSYPRTAGQVPIYYGHKVSGGRSHWKGEYVDCSNEPLHPFGYGLTYSRFELEPEDPDDGDMPTAVSSGEVIEVRASLTNVGEVRADEVVQLYSRDPVSTITRPVLELQGFVRATLDPGERCTVTFELAADALGFAGPDLDYGLEPGEIELYVGTSSDDIELARRVAIIGDGWIPASLPPLTPGSIGNRSRSG